MPNTVTCDTTVTTFTTNTNAASTTSNDYKQEFTSDGAVTGAVNAGQTVSGEGLWISTTEPGSPVTFTNNGAVTGAGNGIHLSSADGNIAYSGNGSATGGAVGLSAVSSSGNGAIAVGTSSAPVAANFSGGSGITAQSNDGAINVFLNGGSVTATASTGFGLGMQSNGGSLSGVLTGNTTITNASGTPDSSIGIFALSLGTFGGAVDIISDANIGSAGALFRTGIQASRSGNGEVNLSQTGGTIFADTTGLTAFNSGGAGTVSVNTSAGSTINVSSVSSVPGSTSTKGVWAFTQGTGAVNVTTAGTISGASAGIEATISNAANNNDVTVAVNGNITAASAGISAGTTGAGNLNVSVGSGATVQGITGQGVIFQGGAVNTLTNSGSIGGDTGIVTTAGSTTITNAGSITGTSGLALFLFGANNLFIMSGPAATLTGGALGSGTDTFRFAGSGSNSFDLSLIGSGWALLDKTGSSNWTLTGTSTYAGPVTVNGGTLSVNTDLSAASLLTVNAGGMLGGNGTVGETLINGGTLAPGNSIGTLSVSGNLTLTTAATYLVQISGTTSDKTSVTGTATLAGTVVVDPLTRLTATTTYTIMTAGTVSGTFAGVNFLTPSIFASNARLSYVGNDVLLTLDPGLTSFSLPGTATINEKNVAAGLEKVLAGGGAIPAGFNALFALSGDALLKALTQASGETATGSQQATFDAMNLFMGLMTDPFTAGRDFNAPTVSGYAGDALGYAARRKPSDAFAMFAKAPPRAFEARWNVWAAGYGGSQTTSGSSTLGSSNATSRIGGLAVGADYWMAPTTVAGFALAGGGTSFSLANAGSGQSDLFQAGAFIRHNVASAYITAAAAYGWQDITTDRTVTIAGTDRLRAEYNANSYSARVEGGNRFVVPSFGGVGVTPYAAVQVTAFDLPAYAESANGGGGTFALNYAAKTVTDTRTELGLRSDKSFAVSDAMLTLRGRAAWAHDTNTDRSASATFQSLPGASFVVNGAAVAHDAALTTAAAEMTFRNGVSLAATFEGEFSDVTRSYAGKGVVRYQW
ncbi:autotransporter domain-containing protein [Tardiphaga robiniae]|uniref:autotransporter domain-containing protein n=1 Tax=Tardiphaga robiniae TaxID=943830 RepID=UPI0015867D00|nr:autotransporter domain-containing protein [Tardiphaga robiniae]